MSQFFIKAGDLIPEVEATLTDEAGAVVDLSTAAGASVRLELPDGSKSTGVATIYDAANGVVRYAWVAGDTAMVGVVKLEFVIVWAGSKPSTYPSNGHIAITVNESLA